MINSTVVTLSEQVNSLDLPKMARRLAGDLRALILVYNTPQAVPPPLLTTTLNQLQTRAKTEISKFNVSGEFLYISRNSSVGMFAVLLDVDNKGGESDVQQGDIDKPSTSKQGEGKPVIKPEESTGKAKDAENLKHESDSETQNTSCSDESIEESKPKIPGPLENLKLLSSTVDELLAVIRNKA